MVAGLTVFLQSHSIASQSVPRTLRAAAELAPIAFAGTVQSFSYKTDGNTPLTLIRFIGVKFVSSRQRDSSLVLSVWGNWASAIVEVPRLKVGERYIILAADTGTPENWYLPFVGLSQGVFRVGVDPRSGRDIVYDWDGQPVLAIKGGHLALLSQRDLGEGVEFVPGVGARLEKSTEPAFEIYSRRSDPGTRVTEKEFLDALRDFQQ